jgi:hypothetical protein
MFIAYAEASSCHWSRMEYLHVLNNTELLVQGVLPLLSRQVRSGLVVLSSLTVCLQTSKHTHLPLSLVHRQFTTLFASTDALLFRSK